VALSELRCPETESNQSGQKMPQTPGVREVKLKERKKRTKRQRLPVWKRGESNEEWGGMGLESANYLLTYQSTSTGWIPTWGKKHS